MELKQFVTTTLNDILDGVAESQKHAKEIGAAVNPIRDHSQNTTVVNQYVLPVQNIEFDVVVTVSNEDKTKGGIGVLSAVLNVGVQAEDNQTNNQTSRIKFSVPVVFTRSS